MPILRESGDVAPLTINGIAVAVLLAIAAIVAAVWAVDDHFISRREFNAEMRMVSSQLKALNSHFGVRSPPVPTRESDEP